MIHRILWTFCALLALAASPAFAASKAAVEQQFQRYIAGNLLAAARAAGISETTYRSAMTGVSLNWDLPDLVPPGTKPPRETKQSQAEFSAPAAYFNEKKMRPLASAGREFARSHARLLARVEKTYGVPGTIVLAIWGRETGYGKAKIPYSAIEVLATKAFMSTRKDYFRDELLAALTILERGIPASRMKSSWAGALGQPQFMPSSYLKYAVDFDGDGTADIWNSVDDTFASIANYLVQSGWKPGRTTAVEVSLPAKVSCTLEGPDQGRPLADFLGAGVEPLAGGFARADRAGETLLVAPAGRHGPAFLVSPNFYVIKTYNNSDLYALFIANLAERIRGKGGPFRTAFEPVGGMLRSDIQAMQQALVGMGHDVGKVDGLPGFKTRRSIGLWQAKAGLAETCFPAPELKARLR